MALKHCFVEAKAAIRLKHYSTWYLGIALPRNGPCRSLSWVCDLAISSLLKMQSNTFERAWPRELSALFGMYRQEADTVRNPLYWNPVASPSLPRHPPGSATSQQGRLV